ncbi:MAG: hypothetical protein B6I38_01580 [Anaerolineaceae bacterium 4572_5.1]|nr:MAG: hypothetical protein B6I38_01580 [Anaerolineaceae bacterium 4572_5.1]
MTTSTLRTHLPIIITTQATGPHPEMTRVLAAAVVNKQFCKTLLNDPAQALSSGYQGEKFILTDLERDLLLSIRANSLSELAGQLISTLEIGASQHLQYPQTDIQRTFNTL